MVKSIKGIQRIRVALLAGTGAAIMTGLILPGAACAQDIAPNQSETPAALIEKGPAAGSEIIVTGTRVIRDGYKAPTPTSVVGAADIAAKAPSNIADYINELPSLAATNTPRANGSFVSSGLVGINALNLRNLGESRTLVLLDGQRVGASSLTGLVDVNMIPQALIKRVDIVTGGASASWGSDAVAGVVDFVLDKDFTDLKGDFQGGVTTYGDDRSWKISLTAGAPFAGGRGHILISGELAANDGITGFGKRDWYNGAKIIPNPNYTTTNGQPSLITVPKVGYTATPGGFIVDGPLAGTFFGAGGTPGVLPAGPQSGFLYMQNGGAWPYNDIGQTGDLDPKMTRQNIFGRVSYDVADNFQVFAQGSFARATSHNLTLDYIGYLSIKPDNAFLPAALAGKVTAPFTLGITPTDIGPIPADSRRTSFRWVVGANGNFNALGSNWKWDVYWQESINKSYASTYIPINNNLTNATDAVRNANGVIVCRSTLTNPNDGCIPFNPMGTGVNSAAAVAYVNGLAFGTNRLTQDVGAFTLRGEPFSTWAGPVSIATGIEHRREGVSGTNDPLSNSNAYWAGNYHASFGSYNVTEGFLETVVPLAKNLPFADSLDLNAAVRATNYSTSGYVTTWKVGVTYSPVKDITFRATLSRDIRAPNLAELFQAGLTQTGIVSDPVKGTSPTVNLITSGNTNLKPEKADALGVGVVLQPSFIPGFAASVDYYDIRINGAISTVDAQTEINQCRGGVAAFCSLITRDASGVITSVNSSPVNFATQISRGLDFEASYRAEVFGGQISVRGLATRYLKNYFDNGISPPTDTVGTNGLNVFLKDSLPKWRYSATIGFDRDPVAFSLTARGFSAGVENTTYIQCTTACPVQTPAQAAAHPTISDNRLPGALYFDTSFSVKLPHQIVAYFAVDNLLNRDPAQVAYGPGLAIAPASINPVLYDTIGRKFRVGLRFKM